MISYYGLYCLMMLCMNGLTSANNDTQTDPPKQADLPNQAEQPKELNDSKCKPNEVLTAKKGCVNREEYMERILMDTWVDENLDAAKNKAGLERTVECQEGEILTAFGCAPEKQPLRNSKWERPTILHSHLYGNKVFKSSDGIPDTDTSKEALDKLLGSSNIGSDANSVSRGTLKKGGRPRNLDIDENLTGDRTIGHNRPRSYVFLPGRKLQSNRKCRPYEVLGRNDRCIRKLGRTGLYKHNDHQYGRQLRHRHDASNLS
ncbi:uncharacterized protein LOC117792596 [Drosophila innubila]|uniref:uncharacterized protein LOC117792596 n=1 Tax=Drosophila innubila TaxID=198719 RepID=UPI00148B59F4|nr:uncharacterized protein LOC117792596 [Drosophila innubila]